jgi:hypothetical protein
MSEMTIIVSLATDETMTRRNYMLNVSTFSPKFIRPCHPISDPPREEAGYKSRSKTASASRFSRTATGCGSKAGAGMIARGEPCGSPASHPLPLRAVRCRLNVFYTY